MKIEEEEEEQLLEDRDVSSSECCKEQTMEIKALESGWRKYTRDST